MSNAELWTFVREYGLTGWEAGAGLFGLMLLMLEIYTMPSLFRKQHSELKYKDVLGPFIGLFVVGISWFFAYGLLRERYLLQPGKGRYTVATVFKRDTQRGKQRFACEYYLAGERHQTGERCGSENGYALVCPAVGQRLYIYYAPESPGTAQVLAVPVPDTLRHIPPLGWAKLP